MGIIVHMLYICNKKNDFKPKFTDFQIDLEKDTDVTLLKGFKKTITSGFQRERRKIESEHNRVRIFS